MSDGEIERSVQRVLEDLRPNLQMDGNDVHLASCENGVVSVQLEGDGVRSSITCHGLQDTVYNTIRENIPFVEDIIVYASDGL